MSYSVKEIYYTLQGEGANTGRAAVFCRFSGCNLWTGEERHRDSAVCQFCDTDFVGIDGPGGGKFSLAADLVRAVDEKFPEQSGDAEKLVICTGGEPLLQLDDRLVNAFHIAGIEVAIETNGTRSAPEGVDWICVSPKAGTNLALLCGNELKLVFPQEGAFPEQFEHLEFEYFFLQPMDGPDREINTEMAIAYCLTHPKWRLSLQTHKYLKIR
jgi:7-carboxy-7-deazaguanine synthase